MLNTLDKYNNKYNAVHIINQIYLKEHLQSMVKVHELLDLQRKVEEEKKWLEESQYNVPEGCKK